MILLRQGDFFVPLSPVEPFARPLCWIAAFGPDGNYDPDMYCTLRGLPAAARRAALFLGAGLKTADQSYNGLALLVAFYSASLGIYGDGWAAPALLVSLRHEGFLHRETLLAHSPASKGAIVLIYKLLEGSPVFTSFSARFDDRPWQATLQRPPLDALVKRPAHPALARCLLELGVLLSYPVDTTFPSALALTVAAALLHQPVAWIGERSLEGATRTFLVTAVANAMEQAGTHPSLDQLVAPVLAAIAASGSTEEIETEDQLHVVLQPQKAVDTQCGLLDIRNAWAATSHVYLFTVKADRLGFSRLKGPRAEGRQALLWGVYDSPPEQDEARALHRLHSNLQTVEYVAGWAWVERNLAVVPYGTWLWVRH